MTPKEYREIISAYESDFKGFLDRGKEIVKRYRDDSKGVTSGKKIWSDGRYSILWSNVQTLSPALFSRIPGVVCERKFKDPDALGRFMAEIAERVGHCMANQPCYESTVQACVEDLLLPGRAVPWARYEATYGGPILEDDGQPRLDEEGNPIDSVEDEEVTCEYVPWNRFGHSNAVTYDKTKIRWRVVELERKDAEKRFGKKAKDIIKFDKSDKDKGDREGKHCDKADIVELWDENEKKVFWFQLNGDTEKFLDEKEDFLGLANFFPCPEPLYATTTNDSLVPIGDYCFYQEQAEQLDLAVHRRQLLISAIRVVGAYNSAHPELKSLLKDAAENEMIPIKNFVDFGQSGGIAGQTDFLPIEPMVKVLQILNQQIQDLKAEIYEITGISDIIRGHTAPSETATAQQLKGQFATLRLAPRQRKVQKFARDLLRIMTELALEKFSDEKIAAIINLSSFAPELQQMFPEALQALRDDKMREYKIDIETDSMVAMDEDAEAQRRNQALEAFSMFIDKAMAGIQQMPSIAPLFKEMLMFHVRTFRGGRQLEFSIEQAMDSVVQQAMQPPPPQEPPPPDPNIQKNQMDAELKSRELELKARQQMFEEQARQVQLDLESRAMVIKETEIALKIESEKAKAQIESDRLLSEIASGGTPGMTAAPKTSEAASQSPIALTINMPGQSSKKRVMLSTDPITGMKVGQIQDEPEVTV
jgi:hypothetical protein